MTSESPPATAVDAIVEHVFSAALGTMDLLAIAVGDRFETDRIRFRLPPGAAEVLAGPESLNYLAPLARQLAAAAVQLPAIAVAFRSGGGVSWPSYGKDGRESQADIDADTVQLARNNVAEAGLSDQINVHCADIGSVRSRQYDLPVHHDMWRFYRLDMPTQETR
ncbi:MAG TPA: hypothetical protein VHC49_01425 [Mycobacteriales bacterium]|nr:hypothetical protein [Mycobacteriales bacterium]